MTPLEMVREFATAMGQPLDLSTDYEKATPAEAEYIITRATMFDEEVDELRDAETFTEMLKEMADVVYVTYGLAATFGLDLDEALRRVHASNMSKLDDDGKPIRRADGKILKGPNYKPPNLEDLIP